MVTPTEKIKTTMENIAAGSTFSFQENTNHPGFRKLSNLYAVNLATGLVGCNAESSDDAKCLTVYFHRASEVSYGTLVITD
jgi:hypothetical protein